MANLTNIERREQDKTGFTTAVQGGNAADENAAAVKAATSPQSPSSFANPLAERLRITLDYDQLTNCMRCGFCLPACPTFRETGIEAESPRGRIALMKAAADGLMAPDRAFEEQMDHCLGCRACETACPADVKYGQLLEQARDSIERHTSRHRLWVRAARRIAFKGVFPRQKRMRLIGGALKLYQKSGLRKLARSLGVMKLFPPHLAQMERILPDASYKGVAEQIGVRHPAAGERIGTVGLFRGCIMDVLFTDTNKNTVKLLQAAGFDVVIPPEQNCCGALHAHSGERDDARELARRNIRAFKAAGVDWIVSNAGGCGALLVEYDHLLQDDPAYKEDAAWFASRTIDISKLLFEHGRLPDAFGQATAGDGSQEASKVRVTYQDSCHLRNGMKSADAPRRLIRKVADAEFVELFEADRCCGSAGIYNLTQPQTSMNILDEKMGHVKHTQAHYLLTSNPGCLLQMKLGIEREGMSKQMKAVHIVDFLAERIGTSG